jgi:hypothetical protein
MNEENEKEKARRIFIFEKWKREKNKTLNTSLVTYTQTPAHSSFFFIAVRVLASTLFWSHLEKDKYKILPRKT